MSAREELASLPLHDRIALVIRKAELTQEQFAQLVGADRPRVNAWVKGRSGVSQEYARKIAAVASQLWREELSASLFSREPAATHADAVSQLAQTAKSLAEATQALVVLLAEQRAVVEQLSRLVSRLEREEPVAGGRPG